MSAVSIAERSTGVARIGSLEERLRVGTERSLDGKTLLVLEAGESGTSAYRVLDGGDAAIVEARYVARTHLSGPRVGDFVEFSDGTVRQVSYDWSRHDMEGLQTSDLGEGRFYLCSTGGLDFSGGLHPCVPRELFTPTGETRDAVAWIFHHDRHVAHNGVEFRMPVAVWRIDTTPSEAERQMRSRLEA